ncbi:hypothetical protein BS329_15845 [Amycolatopsis coloradensis]|uniref:Peptidase S1 domain-containing protein n=1 Tax=Amycolatopsis coloradensis TaxID=76021 RepID=A0A1R0KUB4_9PSEU|nr:hypothetical protein BS329_15845 [Amycolatopsis coloradensis]
MVRGAVLALAGISIAGLGAAPAAAADAGHDGDVSPMIVGGEPAPVAYAGIGSLQKPTKGFPDWHTCGVARISEKFALTAAHCVSTPPAAALDRAGKQGDAAWRALQMSAPTARGDQQSQPDPSDPAQYRIRFESTNRFFGGVTRGVRTITLPQKWGWGEPDKDGKIWDIALLELDRPVKTGRPGLVGIPRDGTPALEIGWGMHTPNPADWGAPTPAQLMQLRVPITTPADCAAAGIGAAEICLGTAPNGGTACVGDSGSGAIQRYGREWVVVALASRSLTQACVSPTVYTEIAPYGGWIIREALKRGEWIAQADLTVAQ